MWFPSATATCTSPISCLIPSFYLGVKSLLVFAAAIAFGMGAIGTVVWLLRRDSR